LSRSVVNGSGPGSAENDLASSSETSLQYVAEFPVCLFLGLVVLLFCPITGPLLSPGLWFDSATARRTT
jgi:hypothetical protein